MTILFFIKLSEPKRSRGLTLKSSEIISDSSFEYDEGIGLYFPAKTFLYKLSKSRPLKGG